MYKLFNPTLKQKELAVGHFLYRVWQLMNASSYPKVDDRIIHNALIESTLTHSRALYEFFGRTKRFRDHKDKSEKDDVLVADYGFTSSKVSINKDYLMRLNKDLAHFTYSERVTKEQKAWDYRQLVQPILLRSREFIEHLLQKYPALTSDQVIECKQQLSEMDVWLKQMKIEK